MRLLLDEMYPAVAAERLRARGHDVQAVTARAELRGLPDLDLLVAARTERRTVVTENIADFVGIVDVSPRLSRVLTGRTTARLGDSIEGTIESLRCGVRT